MPRVTPTVNRARKQQPDFTPSLHTFTPEGVSVVTPNWIIVDAAIHPQWKEADRNTKKVGSPGPEASPEGDCATGGVEEILGSE